MFGGLVDAVTSVAVPVASGFLRRTPLGMAASAGIAAVGSAWKYGKDGDLSAEDWGKIGLDTAGNVAGSLVGPLAFKGLKNSALKGVFSKPKVPASAMKNSNPKKVAAQYRGKEGLRRLFYSDQKSQTGLLKGDNLTKLGKGYATAGSFLGYRPGDLSGTGSLSGVKQVPTREIGKKNRTG